jgi:hypothetical protein
MKAVRLIVFILVPLLLGMAIGRLSVATDIDARTPQLSWQPSGEMQQPRFAAVIGVDTVLVIARGDDRLERMVGGPMFDIEWRGSRLYSQDQIVQLVEMTATYVATAYSRWPKQ